MKKSALSSLVAASLLALSTPAIFAEDAPSSSLPMSTILQNLHTKGYVVIEKVEFSDDKYEVDAINSQGKEDTIHVNAQSGEILDQKSSVGLTALEVAKKVEAAGYHNIYKLDADRDDYVVKAIDKSGKKVKLKVNATSGAISKD